MKSTPVIKDLIVLVADKNMQATVESLLHRCEALGIRPITADVRVHPRNDSGCRVYAADFLAPLSRHYSYVMVVFDHEGSGAESKAVIEIEAGLKQQLSITGWDNRCEVVVIEPELEAWVWSPSRKVDEICGWSGSIPTLRDWISDRFVMGQNGKPLRPKEALEDALREKQKVRSSSLFRELAGKASWKGCTDHSFQRFVDSLRNWFPSIT